MDFSQSIMNLNLQSINYIQFQEDDLLFHVFDVWACPARSVAREQYYKKNVTQRIT